MEKYKLNIAFDFENDDQNVAIRDAKSTLFELKLKELTHRFYGTAQVSLTREGDRSGSNLLAPVNDKHFKHHKVPVTEIDLD